MNTGLLSRMQMVWLNRLATGPYYLRNTSYDALTRLRRLGFVKLESTGVMVVVTLTRSGYALANPTRSWSSAARPLNAKKD